MSGIYYDTFIFYYTTSSSCFTQQCWDYSWCSTPGTSVLSVEVMVKSMVNDQSDQWRPGHGWCKHYLMLTIGGGGSQGNMVKHWIVTEQNTGTGAPPPATILTVFDHLNISSKHWDDGEWGEWLCFVLRMNRKLFTSFYSTQLMQELLYHQPIQVCVTQLWCETMRCEK